MSDVLEVLHLADEHGVPQVQIGGGRVESDLDDEGAPRRLAPRPAARGGRPRARCPHSRASGTQGARRSASAGTIAAPRSLVSAPPFTPCHRCADYVDPEARASMTRRERRRPESDERRTHRRVPARDLPSLAAHISGGACVTLLDVSQGGVRLETTRHMRPGPRTSACASRSRNSVVTMSARVVRAAVVRLHPEEVRYETGLRLVDEFSCDQLQVALVERRCRPATARALRSITPTTSSSRG